MEHAKNLIANEALNASSSTLGQDQSLESRTSGSDRGLAASSQSHYIKRQANLLTLDEPLKTTVVETIH
jgi:hypothetical protein